jgi:hypothetical protein
MLASAKFFCPFSSLTAESTRVEASMQYQFMRFFSFFFRFALALFDGLFYDQEWKPQ